MEQLLKKVILAGIGALSLTRETVEKLLNELAKKGEIAYEDKEDFLKELIQKGKEQKEGLEKMIERVISRTRLATREDIEKLEKRVEELEKKIETSS